MSATKRCKVGQRLTIIFLSLALFTNARAQDSLHVYSLGSVPGVSDWVQYLAMQDSLVFVAEGDSGLRIINIADPANPVVISTFNDGDFVQAVAAAGHYAYILNSFMVQVLDVANPAEPVLRGSCEPQVGVCWNITAAGRYVYVSDLIGGFAIVNVTDPTAPVQMGYYAGWAGTWDVAVAGDYAYVAHDAAGLMVVDVSNPTAPEEVGSCDPHSFASLCIGVDVHGDYAYVADASGLQIIDISNPEFPIEAAYVNGSSLTFDVVWSRDYAFVVDGWAGLRVYDVENPAVPTLTGYYNTPGNAMGVAIRGCIVAVGDSSATRLYGVSYFIPCRPPRAPEQFVICRPPRSDIMKLRWARVTEDTTGLPIDVDYYVIYRSANPDSAEWDSIGVPRPPDTTVFFDSSATRARNFYQVRAVVE